jgi:hypothetical protein
MLDDILSALDTPRQALWNVGSGLAEGDFEKALPGLLGAGAGLGLAATGVGLPLALLAGSAFGGGAQGLFGSDAPTREEVGSKFNQAVGIDDDSTLGMGTGILSSTMTDPLSYLPFAGAAKAAKTPISGGLTHYTTPQTSALIKEGSALAPPNTLLGRSNGMFALPSSSEGGSNAVRSLLQAGISPKSSVPIPIPQSAVSNFENIAPIGPYSLWKSLGGAKMAPPGKLDLASGAFTPTGSMAAARARFYAPDLLMNPLMAATMYEGTKRPQIPIDPQLE